MLREIRLYGDLGRRFGRVHYFAVDSVGEAVRALMANFAEFERALTEHKAGFRVWSGADRIAQAEDMKNPSSKREIIRIAPAIAGAKQGLGQTILGAVLVAAAVVGNIYFPGNPISNYAGNIGFAMVLGGVAQMLAPQPPNDAGTQDKNSPSYTFNGAVNTTAQGHPVPVGYGRLIVGSAVISAGIQTEDIAL
jgi:predicted phage tail protein